MKKVFILLLFLILAGGVLAMDEPVTVKTALGDWVRIFAWPVETGPLLGLGDGIADEEGVFSYTFFSLSVQDVKFRVFIIRNNEKIMEQDFLGHNISEELNIDCSGSGCVVVSGVLGDGEVEVVSGVVNETEVMVDVIENKSDGSPGLVGVYLTGKAIFLNDNGSVDLGNLAWGGMMLLLISMFIFMVFRRVNVAKVNVEGNDEKELKDVEKRVRDTAEKIKDVRDKKNRKEKIEVAKSKLVEEEAELKSLEEGEKTDKDEVNAQDLI